MKNRIPRREWCGVGKALDHPAVTVEKLTLHSWNAEGHQRSDAMRCHPVEHLILNDQSAASSAKCRRRLLVNLDIATHASQCDTYGQPRNRTADNDDFR